MSVFWLACKLVTTFTSTLLPHSVYTSDILIWNACCPHSRLWYCTMIPPTASSELRLLPIFCKFQFCVRSHVHFRANSFRAPRVRSDSVNLRSTNSAGICIFIDCFNFFSEFDKPKYLLICSLLSFSRVYWSVMKWNIFSATEKSWGKKSP